VRLHLCQRNFFACGKRVVAAMTGLNAAGPLSHVTFLLNFVDQLQCNTIAKRARIKLL